MNKSRSTRGLAILAGGLAFVGSANALDLIVNGSFEDAGSTTDITPNGWTGVCRGYNFSAAYYTGPAIPESENPGSVYTWRHRGSSTDEAFATPMTQTVNLLTAVTASQIDSGGAQYTFSAWLASYGQPGSNPDQPYVTLRFFDGSSAQVGATVALDRTSSSFFTTFADGVTVFDSTTHLHDWAKYIRVSSIPASARTATVGVEHSPNASFSGGPDTYTDLVKLDVIAAMTRPSLDSASPVGPGTPATPNIRVTLQDGSVTVNESSIQLSYDDAAVVPNIAKVGQITTIEYSPGLLLPGSSHSYTVVYEDNGTPVQRATNTFAFTVADYKTVPPAYARPPGSANTPGFKYRTVQAQGATLPNTLARARAQLNGTLIDPNTGQPFANVATPGPNLDGSYDIDGVLNFEQSGIAAGGFPNDQPFPGLAPADQNNFATEALLYLDMPAGSYRFGVNSDDGFEVSVGSDPFDVLTPFTVLGEYDGGRGTDDTLFDFHVPAAGVYCVRVIFFEGDGGASCEFFSIDPATGVRTLINDPGTTASIKSYRELTGVNPPAYVREVQPAAGATDIPIETAITAVIWDRATAVQDGTVQLTLNGTPVVADVTRSGITTMIGYQPPAPLGYRTTNSVQLSFNDGATTILKSWSFVTRGAEQPPAITGHWDFDSGSLAATIGLPLEYFGQTETQTEFGSTSSFGIPGIAGFPAQVVKLPAAVNNTIGLMMRHGAVPNGGETATKVNQWTLIMDILIPVQTGQWHSYVQIDTPGNTSDGELFANFGSANGTSGGLGISSQYGGANAVIKGQWHRVAFAVDSSTVITKYIDGVKFADQTSWSGQGPDGRHAMLDRAILFGDDSGEGLQCYVNSVQFRNYKMRDSELEALGGPDANGIPTVSGQWDFEDQSEFGAALKATIGADLGFLPDTEFSTTFIPVPFGSAEANIMIYSAGSTSDGYVVVPGGIGNGGGEKINQYTLVMDHLIPAATINSWHALWQTRTNNNDDASLFIRPASSGGGVGISGAYHGNLLPDIWYRLAFTFDLTTRTLKKYTNGVLAGEQTLGEGVDGRWSTGPTALVFADNDGDNSEGYCNSIQFHPRVLTDAEVLALGGPVAMGIPAALPRPLTISNIITLPFDNEIHWIGGTGPFQIQVRESLTAGAWENYGSPTDGRSAIVERLANTGFIRVVGQ